MSAPAAKKPKAGEEDASLKGLPAVAVDGKGLTVGIVHTRWNAEVVDALVAGAKRSIQANGGKV